MVITTRQLKRKIKAPGSAPPKVSTRSGIAEDEDQRRTFTQLCHVISLRRSGMDKSAVDSLVETVSVMEGRTGFRDAADVVEALDTFFDVKARIEDVQRSIDASVREGRLTVDTTRGRIHPSIELQAEIQGRIAEATRLEADVRDGWAADLVAERIATLEHADPLWKCLQAYMAQVFRAEGALAAQLLDPGVVIPDTEAASRQAALEAALGSLPCDKVVGRRAIANFFSKMGPERTQYVAQLVDGTYTFLALSVHEATREYVRSQIQPLKVFLDTNFIFGLLDLHSNVLGDASRELVEVIHSNNFPFTLYYHEETLEEIRRTIGGIGRNLRGRQWPQGISRAAISRRILGELSGIEIRYHQLNAETPVDPDLFLRKYEHIETLLGDFGVVLYREPEHRGYDVQKKAELIAEYEAFVRQHRPNAPKPYEALDHDIVVWLAAQRYRHHAKSALSSGALFLSNDFLLQRFDWTVLRDSASGSIVLPTQLLQVLRPLVQGDADFDARFVQTFSVAEFRTAHSDYTRVTADVLGLLATYRDVAPETAVRILADEVLLDQLTGVQNQDVQFRELVESAVVRENAQLIEETEALRRERDSLRADIDAALDAKKAVIREAATELELADSKVAEHERRVRDEERTRAAADADALHGRMKETEARTQELERVVGDSNRSIRILVGVLMLLGGGFLIGAVPALTHWTWLEQHEHRFGIYVLIALIWGALTWAVVDRRRWKWPLGTAAIGALLSLSEIV